MIATNHSVAQVLTPVLEVSPELASGILTSHRALMLALLPSLLFCSACVEGGQQVPLSPARNQPSHAAQDSPPVVNQETGCELYGGACAPQLE